MKIQILAAAAASLLAAAANAQVLDGGFELPINAANGWTTNTGFTQNTFGLTTFLPHSGSFYAAATSTSNGTRTNTLSQVLALNAGDVVDFSLWYELSNSTGANLKVTLDGNLIVNVTPGANILAWTNALVSGITINNANPTLTIAQTVSTRTSSFVLDDVSVTVTPAPSAAFLGLGAVGLLARRRR